jgi:ribosomal-protein-serine acetyltransferase
MRNGKSTLKVSTQIELRLPDLQYAEELFAIVDQHKTYLKQWLIWVEQTKSVQDVSEFIKTSQLFNNGGQRLTTFIFKNDKLVGSISLVKIDKGNKSAELGYWLREDFQGQGIMTQSCRTLINYVFNHLDLNRIEIKIASKNLKSMAIPKNLEFSHEGTLREGLFIHNIFYDLEIFSIIKSEWTKSFKA